MLKASLSVSQAPYQRKELTEKITDLVPGSHLRNRKNDITPKVNEVFSPRPRDPKNLESSMSTVRSFSIQSTVDTRESTNLNTKGRDLFKKGDPNGALKEFEKSLDLLNDGGQYTQAFAVACCGKASCLEDLGNPTEAISWFIKALEIYETRSIGNPKEVAEKIASIYESLGESTGALNYFLKCESSSIINLRIAHLYDELNNPAKALEYLHLSIQDGSATPEIYDLMGALHDELGDTENAKACYSKSFISKLPINQDGILFTRQLLKSVYSNFKATQSLSKGSLTGKARCLFQSADKGFKRYVRAVQVKSDLFPTDPKISLLWRELGDLYKTQGKDAEAKACFDKANVEVAEQVREFATQMSPKRTPISKEMEMLIDDLTNYTSSKDDKKQAAKDLKTLLLEYQQGTKEAKQVEDYLLKAFKIKPNPIFAATLGSNLEEHFKKALNLIPQSKKG